MVGSSGRPYLAQSLSAVAIAALDGVVPVLGTATGEVVRHLVARYGATPELRALHRRTTTAVLRWAEGEGLSEVEQGLSLATHTVARYGLTHEQIAQERFDPGQVAERVLADARRTDPDWGRRGLWRQRVQEDRHVVAERAVAETYAALIGELRADEPVLLPALTAVLDEIGRLGLGVGAAAQDLDELRAALVRGATVGEVMAYLRTRIADWDSPVWSGRVPSSIERRLSARTVGDQPGTESRDLSEQEALEHQQMLVVLGGPGSGKTWLARRYARNAARHALARLESGASLGDVEIPLFTTWDRWAQTPGSGVRETLVASSFDPALGHSDVVGHDLSGQLQRTLVLAETRVLLVVDSLDEAADRENQDSQGNRVHSLASLSGERCRVVVTSRPSAWHGVRGRLPSSRGPLRVVGLHELPTDDVEGFVEAWFATDADRARALIRQLRERPDLARAAVVPLNLTFYCSIAAEVPRAEVDDARTLPVRRHALYARIVRRTFHHVDSSKGAGAVGRDPDERMRVLAAWAWHAVRRAGTPTGLGNWGETFTQPPGTYDDAALDAIAPKVRVDDEGVVTRRFQHRTLLEHFVAEYVAELPTDEAAEILFPHLWYDPDWAVAAPAAIAAHNRRRPGELLARICDDFAAYRGTTGHATPSSARTQVAQAFDCQLLRVASDSDPEEWPGASQDLLDACRARCVVWMPDLTLNPADLLARTAHWERSNADIVAQVDLSQAGVVWVELVGRLLRHGGQDLEPVWAALLGGLAGPCRGGWASFWVTSYLSLDPGPKERARARAAVLRAISSPGEDRRQSLVEALVRLGPDDAERAAARSVLLDLLEEANGSSFEVTSLVRTLLSVEPGDADRARARAVVLERCAAPDLGVFERTDLAKAFLSLGPTAGERASARAVVLEQLLGAHPSVVGDHIGLLTLLGPTAGERARVWAAALPLVLDPDFFAADRVLAALTSLGAGDEDRATARAAVLRELPNVRPSDVPHQVGLLLFLRPGDEERAQARTAVLGQLTSTGPYWADALARALVSLGPDPEERATARAAVLTAVTHRRVAADRVGDLMSALLSLDPSAPELSQARARVREMVLDDLPEEDRFGVEPLVAALSALDPDDAERERARAAVLRVLPEVRDYRLGRTVGLLLSLRPTASDRARARSVVLDRLAGADWVEINELVAVLLLLDPEGAERARAWTTVLDVLVGSKASAAYGVEGLGLLELGAAERAQVHEHARTALSNADDDVVVKLVPGLRRAFALDEWLDVL